MIDPKAFWEDLKHVIFNSVFVIIGVCVIGFVLYWCSVKAYRGIMSTFVTTSEIESLERIGNELQKMRLLLEKKG